MTHVCYKKIKKHSKKNVDIIQTSIPSDNLNDHFGKYLWFAQTQLFFNWFYYIFSELFFELAI